MPKVKTHKATAKRFRRSGAKKGSQKIMRRAAGQDHFNARESGNITRGKRKDKEAHPTNVRAIKQLTPFA
ncbi:MAG: 50S ribosomal protein L35 [Patescibacteria group bacterium]